MHAIPPNLDWSVLGQAIYAYWFITLSVIGAAGVLFRSPIARGASRFISALKSAKYQIKRIESLSESLAAARSQAEDWRSRFSEMEARYEALQAELTRLGDDMHGFLKRMTTDEMLVRVLTKDRDALIDYSRLLIGQMFQAGLKADYEPPSLSSMVEVPGTSLPHIEEKK